MIKYITYRDDGVAMIPFLVAESVATTQKTKINDVDEIIIPRFSS